tara:strand:+ start:23 stop:1402 length:1380 start_codon:yes stop_codon:yes gene_type:complete
MASLLLSEAAKLSNDEVVEGIVEDIITEDMWFQYLPFVQINGLSHVFKREKSLGATDWAGIGQDLSGDEYRAGATFETVNVGIQAIIAEIIIDSQIDDQFSDIDSQLQVQISSKAKAMSRFFMNACINYGSNGFSFTQANNGKIGAVNFDAAPMFKGMRALLDEEVGNAQDVNHPNYNNGQPTQTIELEEDDASSPRFQRAGRVFTLEDLDKLLDIVTKGAEFMLMNKAQRRVLRTLLRNTGGGTDAAQIMRSDLGTGKPILHYQETPVFVSDFVSSVEPVHKLHSTAVTIASTTDTTVTLSADIQAELEADIGTITASNPAYLVSRTGALGRYSKVVLKVTDVAAAVLTVDPSFQITDDEKNRPQALAALSTYNTATGLVGASAEVYERVDGTSIYAGKFGEGEGLCGFTLDMSQAIQIKYVGPRRDEDAEQYRMKFYTGFETYSRLAVARLKSVLPL